METVIGALVERGYGVAYRILDAQYFGVPQRRRRVFIVGCLGDSGRAPAEVLALIEGMRGHLETSNKKRKVIASATPLSTRAGDGTRKVANTIPAEIYHHATVVNQDVDSGHLVVTSSSFGGYKEGVGTLRAEGGDLGGGSENLVVHKE
jgi:DNA (cytosine-5)-methyltransferase 1